MTLSIVIVNYNVKYFLKQCLASVYSSELQLADGSRMELEVWVVDNDSVDGSVEMVRSSFPEAHVIANHDNRGFAKANNQALAEATGDVLLLLNPDTLVEHDTLAQCVDFVRQHPDCGGLCVKMIDGKGNYLKESKRGFPSPETSFYKISGLIHLFPRSRRIAAYYMGHLPDDEVNEVDIMPGAFMMFRREVYDRIGGLDESYFMYAEDIDYSWRIHMLGYKNYYLPTTRIIHYKGESTKKGSMNYVFTFYNAMAIFVGKYFTGTRARLFSALLQVAIWIRAGLAWGQRLVRKAAVPVADFAVAFGGFLLIKQWWATIWANNVNYYPSEYTAFVIPVYILVLMSISWLSGGYDKPVRIGRIIRGMGLGLLLLLAFYSLLDEEQRYSRMLLILGSVWTLVGTVLIRLLLGAAGVKGYALRAHKRGRILIVGSDEEAQRVRELHTSLGIDAAQLTTPPDTQPHHLQDLIRMEHIEEVIFCGRDIELQHIIRLMAQLKTTGVEYKIAPAESDFIIGSSNILSPDDLYIDDLDTISTPTCRRNKRIFDLGTSALLLLLSPVMIWFQRRKSRYYADCWQVLTGRASWVGYTGHRGIFQPSDIGHNLEPTVEQRLTLRYMRHYRTSTDMLILLHNWNNL